MKTCSHCKIEKLELKFHKNCSRGDGLQNQCKDCKAGSSRRHYQLHKKEILEQRRGYWQSPTGKVVQNKANQKRRARYPKKCKAVQTVNNAITAGKLKRPTVCPFCNTHTFIEAHHSDYSKPLEVVWLCRLCHRKLHKSDK